MICVRDEKKNEREKSPKKDVMIRFREASSLSLHLFQSIVKYVQCLETEREGERRKKRQ
jgi:hypothetical protein